MIKGFREKALYQGMSQLQQSSAPRQPQNIEQDNFAAEQLELGMCQAAMVQGLTR